MKFLFAKLIKAKIPYPSYCRIQRRFFKLYRLPYPCFILKCYHKLSQNKLSQVSYRTIGPLVIIVIIIIVIIIFIIIIIIIINIIIIVIIIIITTTTTTTIIIITIIIIFIIINFIIDIFLLFIYLFVFAVKGNE